VANPVACLEECGNEGSDPARKPRVSRGSVNRIYAETYMARNAKAGMALLKPWWPTSRKGRLGEEYAMAPPA
jgi:hypothetical protein